MSFGSSTTFYIKGHLDLLCHWGPLTSTWKATSYTVTQAEELSHGLLCSALLGSHESNGEQAPGTSAPRSSSLFQLDTAHLSAANVLRAATPKGQQDPIIVFSKRHLRGDQLRYGKGSENLTAKQPWGALPFEALQPGQQCPFRRDELAPHEMHPCDCTEE